MSKTAKFITILSVIIAMVSLGIIINVEVPEKPKAGISGMISASNDMGGDFALHDMNGNLVKSDDFRGKYLLVYFGFTFCPDICPTSLLEMSKVIKYLGADASALQPIFITIDPKRDTSEQLKDYFTHFNPSIIPLTGSKEEIDDIAAKFKVYYAVTAASKDDENYMVDHSSFFYFIGKDGKLIKYYNSKITAAEMANDILGYIKN
jgi:protein SCO1/2